MTHTVSLKIKPDVTAVVRLARIVAKHLTALADDLEQEYPA